MYSQVKHIFFDFDNTLWDFEANSKKVLHDLIAEFELEKKCQCKADAFIKTYIIVNDDLWALYRKKAITKDELRSSRFTNTMLYFGYDDLTLGLKLEDEYIARAPHQKGLVPHTIELLDYLYKKYDLHIITNGFKEIQHIKLKTCNIGHYFKNIIISEEVGFNKPDERIFEHSFKLANTTKEESLMIGDDWDADILGPHKIGLKAIYFNRNNKDVSNNLVPEIKSLDELIAML